MKTCITILCLLFVKLSFSQKNSVIFSYIDGKVRSVEFSRPDSLAKRLTESYVSDVEKLRSIFRWVTENIAYRTRPVVTSRKATKYYAVQSEEDVDSSSSLNERIAIDVLKKKEAVCDGYARLLKTLCDYAGLRCEIVTGYARSNINRVGEQFKSNHRWNAVLVDSAWYLMDATWAGGYISNGIEQFVKAYDDHYFMTRPEDFIRDHYPEDSRWTLLANPPTLQEFYRTPFKHSAFSKYSIASFAPAKGIIEASIGDTINVELTLASVERKAIASDTLKEGLEILPPQHALEAVNPWDSSQKQKINYQYTITSENIGWLNIIYNEDVVLRYKLNVRKKEDD
jgi:transglutaminase/protease-like cytokinesis protein 3